MVIEQGAVRAAKQFEAPAHNNKGLVQWGNVAWLSMETSMHRREDVWVIQEHNQTTGCYKHKHKQAATRVTTVE